MSARISLVEMAQMNPLQRAQFDRFPSNLTRALLLLEDRLARALPETANALRTSDLPATLREAVILRVAALQDSGYERFQHLDQARKLGWTDAQLRCIEANDAAGLPTELAIVLTFVDAVVAAPQISDTAFAQARTVLTDRQLVTVVVLVGHYLTVARVLGVLEVPLDQAPDSWTAEH